MGIIKRLKWKDKTGKTTDYDLGAKASNVEQDATHRFVSDTEKQTWNGKADPEDIPSGSAADYGVANNDTTNRTDMLVTAQVAYQHGREIDQLNSELAAMNDNGLITGLEVREGDGVYITYQDGADTVSKKLGNPSKLSFDISGSGDNPNYLSSATFQFHRTSFDGFLNAGYTKCKITFISFSGAQSTGRLDIRKNGVVSTYYTNPGTVEFELEEGDYIAGYVSEQRTFRFSATVTMLC